MNPVPYTLTNESITVIVGGQSHVVRRDAANFKPLRDALVAEKWDTVPSYLTVAKGVEAWAKGAFSVVGNTVHYKGEALPPDLNGRIVGMAAAGNNPTALMRFWERLQQNPSWRSVQQLWKFLEHQGIPIDEDGFILAYKAVKSDYTDFHTGTVGNKPGTVNEMPRNRISDDPNQGCHYGFHVGAIAYAQSFGDADRRMIICKVNPADVVCVPYDAGHQKMRVCKYEVIGNYGSQLPSTAVTHADLGVTTRSGGGHGGEDYEDHDEDPDGVEPDGDEDLDGDACPECHEDIEDCVCEDEPAPKAKPAPKTPVAAGTAPDLDAKDEVQLLDCDLDSLRKYATYGLKIVGASKIPGGKRALVARIVEVRRKG